MRRSQDLTGGPDSTNLQAGRDIVYNGVTAAEARQIALDVYNANFLKLAGVAEDVARDRAERITRRYVETQQTLNPSGLASMGDPDMLRTLYAAQEGYACSGEDDLEQALIDLLVDRAGQTERDLKTHVLNQAVATLPKLTKVQRGAVAVVFAVKNTSYAGPFDLAAFYEYLAHYIVPLVCRLPESTADFGYMQFTGVGSVDAFFQAITLEQAYGEQACGFFSMGFSRESAPDSWRPFLDDPEVFMPCLRDPRKLQIRARSMLEIRKLAKAKNLPELAQKATFSRMPDSNIRADIIAHVPSFETLFDKWEGEPGAGLSTFQLTAVGIAIGHACMRKVVGGIGPLDTFLV